MARAASEQGNRRRQRLQLAERLQLLRLSEREYRLVSLFDSLAVKAPEGVDGMLDRVLPALQRGADLATILNGASRREAAAIRRMVRDFLARGLTETSGGGEPGDAAERSRYREQRQFLANFQPIAGASPVDAAGRNGSPDLQATLKSASVMQVGLGRVGSRLSCALASAGVGTIIGADQAVVTEADLADSAFDAADLGGARETVLQRKIAALNPFVAFSGLTRPLFGPRGIELPDGLQLLVLCEDRFDPEHHAAINRACLAHKVPWLGYRSQGSRIEIGPTVIPHETACYRCYELRRASNFEGFESELELRRRLALTATGVGGLNVTCGVDVLALEVIKSLSHFTSAATYGHVYVMDVVTLQSRLRPLLKIPRCPECGKSAQIPAVNVWRYDTEGETSEF